MCVCAKLLQSHLILCDLADCSPPGFFVRGILQARITWSGLPFPFLRDPPDPGIEPVSLMPPALAGGLFTTSATREAQCHTVYPNFVWHFFCQSFVCAFCPCSCASRLYFYCCIVFHAINIPMFLYLAYHWWTFKLFSLLATTNYITIIFFVHIFLCMCAWSIIFVPRYILHKNS